MIKRRKSRPVKLSSLQIGAEAPITIQSMTNTDTADAKATIQQILRLEEAGCEIVRVSVPNENSAKTIKEIKNNIHIPLVADIHFDYRLAIKAIENGIDKLRINPGNIGSEAKVQELVSIAKERKIPIRIGVNAGSLKKEILRKYGWPSAEALVESALEHVVILEKLSFEDIVISIKASDVKRTVEANRMFAEKTPYPLHIGITEAGLGQMAMIKSAAGLGTLLMEGIGDTVRVSITGDPIQEVEAGLNILKALGIREQGIEIISCPTCARTGKNDLAAVVHEIEEKLPAKVNKKIKIAVMGCIVNGPGEAAEADLGIAFASEKAMLFSHGEKIALLPREEAISALLQELEKHLQE